MAFAAVCLVLTPWLGARASAQDAELADAPIARAVVAAEPHVRKLHEHVTVLASPYFEGRGLETRGIERAADYIEFHLRSLGLEPAFDETIELDSGQTVTAPDATYRQAVTHRTETTSSLRAFRLGSPGSSTGGAPGGKALSVAGASLLPIGGEALVTAPAVFVGYSITVGPGGYINYQGVNSLDGRVAIVLDLEPMEDGQSRWARSGWSSNAETTRKISAAVRRNASAVLMVTPPGAPESAAAWLAQRDERMTELTAYEGVPVLRISAAAADEIVRAGDPEGRSLADLIAAANAAPTVVDLPGAAVTVEVTSSLIRDTTDNIGAILPGAGALADELVVIGAHYDHLGYGLSGTRSPELAGTVHPGADDNASGTASVLVLAELLSERYRSMPADAARRSVLFLWFTAEESGLIGSRHYVDEPARPIADHAVMFNLDMMGRMVDERVFVAGLDRSEGLEELFAPALEASGLHVVRELNIGWDRSDHAPFDSAGVPALFFFTGLHDDYHTALDTADRINRTGTGRIIRLAEAMALAAATSGTRPASPGSARRGVVSAREGITRVVTGLTPSAGASGVRVRRVRADTPAARAGIRPGDVIRSWNGETLEDLGDYTGALRAAEPGQTVTLIVDRGGEEIEIELVLDEE